MKVCVHSLSLPASASLPLIDKRTLWTSSHSPGTGHYIYSIHSLTQYYTLFTPRVLQLASDLSLNSVKGSKVTYSQCWCLMDFTVLTLLYWRFHLVLSFRCFSFVGRRGRGQVVSLSRQGCVFRQIIQHELLHALGFNHEQTRSDRDQNVRILLGNVISGRSQAFILTKAEGTL